MNTLSVTPEMIIAGVNEYCDCVQDIMWIKDSEAVLRIYEAMRQKEILSKPQISEDWV